MASDGEGAGGRGHAIAALVCGIASLACLSVVGHPDSSGRTGGLLYGAPLLGTLAIGISVLARTRGCMTKLSTAALVLGIVGTGGFIVVMAALLVSILCMGR